jgi:hypothetical protein
MIYNLECRINNIGDRSQVRGDRKWRKGAGENRRKGDGENGKRGRKSNE